MPDMKKIGREISICMGVTLSLILSLVGNLMSGHFSSIMFFISFVISTIISLIIGFLVPMGRIHESMVRKFGPGKISGLLLESLISDLIYTPIITICMVTMAYFVAHHQGGQTPPYPVMLLSSMGVCMVVGYVLVLIFQPLYMRLSFKKHGIDPTKGPQGGPPSGKKPEE